jgi:hypothetical protein
MSRSQPPELKISNAIPVLDKQDRRGVPVAPYPDSFITFGRPPICSAIAQRNRGATTAFAQE